MAFHQSHFPGVKGRGGAKIECGFEWKGPESGTTWANRKGVKKAISVLTPYVYIFNKSNFSINAIKCN